MKHLKLFESFADIEIDDRRLYKKLTAPQRLDILMGITNGEISTEIPTEHEKKILKDLNLGMGSIHGSGKRIIKLSDDYWLAIYTLQLWYLCDTLEGVINSPITM